MRMILAASQTSINNAAIEKRMTIYLRCQRDFIERDFTTTNWWDDDSSCYTFDVLNSFDCNAPLHPAARLGIDRFNDGKYWLAHEALEDAWNAETGPVRDLYRGILQAAVVYHHISQQNFRGALKVYQRSQKWLKKWPDTCRGVDVAELRSNLDMALSEVKSLGSENLAKFKSYSQITYEKSTSL